MTLVTKSFGTKPKPLTPSVKDTHAKEKQSHPLLPVLSVAPSTSKHHRSRGYAICEWITNCVIMLILCACAQIAVNPEVHYLYNAVLPQHTRQRKMFDTEVFSVIA